MKDVNFRWQAKIDLQQFFLLTATISQSSVFVAVLLAKFWCEIIVRRCRVRENRPVLFSRISGGIFYLRF